jgi:hypothetical protein
MKIFLPFLIVVVILIYGTAVSEIELVGKEDDLNEVIISNPILRESSRAGLADIDSNIFTNDEPATQASLQSETFTDYPTYKENLRVSRNQIFTWILFWMGVLSGIIGLIVVLCFKFTE